jgi:hypothetical protein
MLPAVPPKEAVPLIEHLDFAGLLTADCVATVKLAKMEAHVGHQTFAASLYALIDASRSTEPTAQSRSFSGSDSST